MVTESTYARRKQRRSEPDDERKTRDQRARAITTAYQAAQLEQARRQAATGRCCTKCLRGTRAMNYGCARYGDCACHRKARAQRRAAA